MAQRAFCHLAPPSSPLFFLSLHIYPMHWAYLTMSNSSNMPCSLSSCLCMCFSWYSIFFSPLISLSNPFNSSLYEFFLKSPVSVTFWQEIAHSKWVTWGEFNKENIYEDVGRMWRDHKGWGSKYPKAKGGGLSSAPSLGKGAVTWTQRQRWMFERCSQPTATCLLCGKELREQIP